MNKIKIMIKNSITNLPAPINISYWWNYGSLLGLFLTIQFISGIFLSIHYCPNISLAFNSIIHIIQNVPNGWAIRNIHANGASFFFMCIYLHISRNIYYNSFNLKNTWLSGTSLFILSMATAFLGYVLPWGQMSFWGATVITNLVSTIPYVGNMIIMWLWGGFSINNSTLNRFFSFHFTLPFIITLFIFIHLFFLHSTGSSNPIGTNSNLHKVPFHIYFSLKDILGFTFFFLLLFIMIMQYPYSLSDPDNFSPSNPLVTPTHIQPEWYFLFAYSILRSIPNKLGGVIALFTSIIILFFMPSIKSMYFSSSSFSFLNQLLYWFFINNFILLTWSGAQLIEPPFILISQILTINYFLFFIMIIPNYKLWIKIINEKKQHN